ncbi:MAG: acyl-CoA thioesterase [Planctomycetota bacterium]
MSFRQSFTVRSYELDSLGHLNNAVYFSWLEEATFAHLGEQGLPFREFAGRGWYPIVVHAELDFRKEASSGERIRVEGWPISYGSTSMRLGYRLLREADDVLIAEGQRVWVFVDQKTGKIPVPVEIREVLGPELGPESRTSLDS